jgi:hypothetical protein
MDARERLTTLAQSTGDTALIEYVGRLLTAPDANSYQAAIGDAKHRLGDLIREL